MPGFREGHKLDHDHIPGRLCCAAFALLLHPEEPTKALMAREERIEDGRRVAKLNLVGGKRAGTETARATAAREATEETGGLLSEATRAALLGAGGPVLWDSQVAHPNPNPTPNNPNS